MLVDKTLRPKEFILIEPNILYHYLITSEFLRFTKIIQLHLFVCYRKKKYNESPS